MTDTRTETDSIGPIEVPADAYWGAQTERSLENFPFGARERMPVEIVRALAYVKLAAARVNKRHGLAGEKAEAIETAARADGVVGFGTTVTFTLDGRERRVTIVGDDEADPAAGLLALSAPLARALMGAAVGETVAFAGKADAIDILEIL